MRNFRQFPCYLAAWMIWAAIPPSRAAITVSAPDVSEGDTGPVSAEFSYGLPAAATPASYEWALLPHRLAAGQDFTPWQTVVNLPVGPAVSSSFSVPILPDAIPEENGLLYLVARPPGAGNWAEAMTAPATVPEFSGGNGSTEVIYWQDGAVIARRRTAGLSYIDVYDRTAAAGMVLKSTLPAPVTTPDIFHQVNMAISDRVIVVSQPGGLNTWLRDTSAPEGWRKLENLPVPFPAKGFIAGDRLFLNILNRSAVYRLDPSLSNGWRQTGGMEAQVPLGAREDLAVVVQYSSLEIWERSSTTEDMWNPTYLIGNTSANIYVGSAEGMVVAQSPAGLDIYERGEDGHTWGKAGTLPVTAAPDEFVTAAPTGDWIAVARVKAPDAATQGAKVALFLRDALNRSLWTPVGEIEYPEARYGSKLFWDQGELILSSFRDDSTSRVITRRFQGGSARIRDDDRSKLALAAAIQLEPESGSAAAECYAEFPLPVPLDVPVSIEFPGGSAVAGQDFNAVAGTVVMPAGNSRVLIPITLLSDNAVEPDKTLTIRLTVPLQPAVEASIVLRDTSPAPVVTAEATPLMEGYAQSTVTLRQTPATGTVLTADPVSLKMTVEGFDNPPAVLEMATTDADLAVVVDNLQISAELPYDSFTVTAKQDTSPEAAEERVRAVWVDASSPVAAGTYGVGLDVEVPVSPVNPGDPTPGDNELFAAGGDWVFGLRSSPSEAISCYRRVGDNKASLELIQTVALDTDGSVSSAATSRIQMASDGETLAVSATRDFITGGRTRNLLGIYRATGPAAAPWQLEWEWNGPVVTDPPGTYQLHLLSDGFLAWGPCLLERCRGPWKWRLLNDAIVNQFPMASPDKVLDTDGRRLVVTGPGTREATVYKRNPGAVSTWSASAPIKILPSGFPVPIEGARIRGRTLYLSPQFGRFSPYREGGFGAWTPDINFPDSITGPPKLTEESVAVFQSGASAKIFSRIGPLSAPWVETGTVPVSVTETLGGMSFSPSTQKLLFHWKQNASSFRIRIFEPGLRLGIVDDDSLTFEVRTDTAIAQPLAAAESYAGETIKSLKVLINRAPPIPLSVRLRSRDTGSASTGQDYAAVDRMIPFGPTSSRTYQFPIRILSDRNLEENETFELVFDPPVFGTVPAPTVFTITDRVGTGIKVTPGTTTMLEPLSGVSVQSVEFTLQTAFDRDVVFTPNRAVAGIGVQFDFPVASVVLKAGSNSLRIPISIFSDDLDESSQSIRLQLTSVPAIAGLPTTLVTLLDAKVSGLTADEGYAVNQGLTLNADGLEGRPSGVQANDPAPPPGGAYLVSPAPAWGTVVMQPNGNFFATPGPNAIGPLLFGYQVEVAPYRLFVDGAASWKYLHPVNGISPAVATPTFPTTWATTGFDDSSWSTGNGTMSYGGFSIPVFPNVTNLPVPTASGRYTSYFRTLFQSPSAGTAPMKIQLYCDDGAVIYVNGVERGRASTGTPLAGFATAQDTYTMVTGGGQTEVQEGSLQEVNLGNIPLQAGDNVLAISLHNLNNSSSDLGLRVERLETTGIITETIPVRLTVADTNTPPVAQPDVFICPQNATFLSSDEYGAGILANDGLLAPDGSFYDPVTEIVVSPVSTGTLEMIGATGHFRYTPPPDFAGNAGFTYQVRDKDGFSQPVIVTLNVKAILPFDMWRQQNLPGGGDGAGSEADADGDGWNNFLEYALTSMPDNPLPAPGIGPEFAFDPAYGLPRFSVKMRRAPDIAYSMESAMSLESPVWQTLFESRGLNYSYTPPGSYVQFLSGTAGSQTVIANPITTLTASPRLFYRLRVERIPPQ